MTADGSPLRFYGEVDLECKIPHLTWRETFIVSQLKDDAILGMPFLVKQQCQLSFTDATLNVPTGAVTCIDKTGTAFVCMVRSQKPLVIPGRTEMVVWGRVAKDPGPRDRVGSVSYTHLTLPTILLV